MNDMVKVDWNAFNYIHSEKAREAFQRLTEQLFCFEYNQPYGIYRYYNQPHLETLPIRCGTDTIGFQSKYYDGATTLSSKKQELLETIGGAHAKYPALTKIVFYINKDPGMSTTHGKTVPQYIEEIEQYGERLGISIVWKGLNQIETMLIKPELCAVRDYFFSVDGGIRKAISQIHSHSNSIFDSIEECIQYNQATIVIPQTPLQIDSFLDSETPYLLVYGDGGCGKSALVKAQLKKERRFPFIVFRATDFDAPSDGDFARRFGIDTLEELLAAFGGASRKLCVVDSAEKVLSMNHRETFVSIVRMFQTHNWHILFTIRTHYLADFENAILKTSDGYKHYLPALSTDALVSLAKEFRFPLPADSNLRKLLCTLFYLKLYLCTDQLSAVRSAAEFMEKLWSQVICESDNIRDSMNVRRGKAIIQMFSEMEESGFSYYFPSAATDWPAITALCESEIIRFDKALEGYFFCHDGYEEIVLNHIISQEYLRKDSINGFFQQIGCSIAARKAFRTWLQFQLESNASEITPFLTSIFDAEDSPLIWRDEILISLFSEQADSGFQLRKSLFIEDNHNLLFRALHLLNIACREVDDAAYRRLRPGIADSTINIYRFTKPFGSGWRFIISLTYEQRGSISWSQERIDTVTSVLSSWSQNCKEGDTTRLAGLLALYLYEISYDNPLWRTPSTDLANKQRNNILCCAKEILPELSNIVERVLSMKTHDRRDAYTVLCENILCNAFYVSPLCSAAPDMIVKLANSFWFGQPQRNLYWEQAPGVSEMFGLHSNYELSYFPSSAYQTPLFPLLQSNPKIAVNYIISLINRTSEAFFTSSFNAEYQECSTIKLILPDGKYVEQYGCDRLWKMYRGTSATPYLLQSALMAFERWLYQMISASSEDHAVHLCLSILSKTKSVSITAVIASMVTAFPDKLFRVACILLHTPALFVWDNYRFVSENTADFMRMGVVKHQLYDTERKESNALPFRKSRLENVIINYQLMPSVQSKDVFQERLGMLETAIDEGFFPEEKLSEDERFVLYRIDIRKMKLEPVKLNDGESAIALVANYPEELVQTQNASAEISRNNEKYLQLLFWSRSRISHDIDGYSKYVQYEANPALALEDVCSLCDEPSNPLGTINLIICVSAALLLHFQDKLTEEQIRECRKIIIDKLKKVLDEKQTLYYGDGAEAAIEALPSLFGKSEITANLDDPVVLLLMLICDWGKQRNKAIAVFKKDVWEKKPLIAKKALSLFVLLKPAYDKEVSCYQGISTSEFVEKHSEIITSIFQQPLRPLPDLSSLSKNSLMTFYAMIPNVEDDYSRDNLLKCSDLLWPDFFNDNRWSQVRDKFQDFHLEHIFLESLANCLLQSSSAFQTILLEKLTSYISLSAHLDSLLVSLIAEQDKQHRTISFWNIWNALFPRVCELYSLQKEQLIADCEDNVMLSYNGIEGNILVTYMFAMQRWKENIHEWHTLDFENAPAFFFRAVNAFGYHPCTLYSISRVLNTVGFGFIYEGVGWLSTIIRENNHLQKCDLPVNTVYYIEEYMHRFISAMTTDLKKNKELRKKALLVLDFLVAKGSTCGFILRDSI